MEISEFKKNVPVRELAKELELKQICGNDESLDRYIIVPDINRPGLELSGYSEDVYLKRVTILGNKEIKYILELDDYTQRLRFETITDPYTPCIIFSCTDYPVPQTLIDVANSKNFPVFKTEMPTYQLIVDLVGFLADRLAPTITVHGVMMDVYGVGVLIEGESGIGKSELALDLIRRGHMLVADDRVDISHVSHRLKCRAPKLLKRMLEIRGVGVVDVNALFGGSSYLPSNHLDFIIELVNWDADVVLDRLNPINEKENLLGVDVPKLIIPVTASKSLSVVIEAAVTNFKLIKNGVNTTEDFKKMVKAEIMKRNEEYSDAD